MLIIVTDILSTLQKLSNRVDCFFLSFSELLTTHTWMITVHGEMFLGGSPQLHLNTLLIKKQLKDKGTIESKNLRKKIIN